MHEGHIVGLRQVAAEASGRPARVLWETHNKHLDGLLAREALDCSLEMGCWAAGMGMAEAKQGGCTGGAEPRGHAHSGCGLPHPRRAPG